MSRLFVAGFFSLTALAQTFPGDLPDATVEKILGLSPVHHQPTKSLKTDIEYETSSGAQLFTLRIRPVKEYADWKQGMNARDVMLPGVGVEAFKQDRLRTVCARSAEKAACVAAYTFPKASQISDAKIIALVKAAIE